MTVMGKKSVLLFLIPGILSAAGFPEAQAAQTRKVKVVWGEAIAYELSTVPDSSVRYDGTAFVVRREENEPVNRVIINTAYFEREAENLWDFFSSGIRPGASSLSRRPDLALSLIALEEKISNGGALSGTEKKEILEELELLERELKIAAWYPVYNKAVTEKKNAAAARRYFIQLFSDIRKSTIEFHELSHLLDERRLRAGLSAEFSGPEQRRFARDSEIRAFITELAYGCNPRDSLWQAVSGVKDEVKQGRDVDASLSKFADVLRASEKTGIPGVRGIVACLCTLSTEQSRAIALRLYDGYRLTFSRITPAA